MINDWLRDDIDAVASGLLEINQVDENTTVAGASGLKRRVVRFIELTRSAMYPEI